VTGLALRHPLATGRSLDVADVHHRYRVEDLAPGELVEVNCACGHQSLLTRDELIKRAIGVLTRIADLRYLLRCPSCQSSTQTEVRVTTVT
jgi:hypothetical protein